MKTYPYSVPNGVNIVPEASGASNLGTAAKPFSGTYSNQYATTLYTTVGESGLNTINWNSGTSQKLNFANAQSGVATIELTNGIAGSSYVLTTMANNSGTTSIAWSGTMLWKGGTTGTMTVASGSSDLFSFYYDGSTYFGNVGNDYK